MVSKKKMKMAVSELRWADTIASDGHKMVVSRRSLQQKTYRRLFPGSQFLGFLVLVL